MANPLDLIIAQATALRGQAEALRMAAEALLVTADAMFARPVAQEDGAPAAPFLMGPAAPRVTPAGPGDDSRIIPPTGAAIRPAPFVTFDGPPAPQPVPAPPAPPARDIAPDHTGDLRPIS